MPLLEIREPLAFSGWVIEHSNIPNRFLVIMNSRFVFHYTTEYNALAFARFEDADKYASLVLNTLYQYRIIHVGKPFGEDGSGFVIGHPTSEYIAYGIDPVGTGIRKILDWRCVSDALLFARRCDAEDMAESCIYEPYVIRERNWTTRDKYA